jgi:hypothetical protein
MIYLSLVVPSTAIPVIAIYLNADATIHIANHVFRAFPIIPYLLKSLFGRMFPLFVLLFRYLIVIHPIYEVLRHLQILVLTIMLTVAQFLDAFGFHHQQFFQNFMNSERQVSLQHVFRYRETFIILDSFGDINSLGPFFALTGIIVSIVYINYCVIKMYASLPSILVFMLVFLLSACLFVLAYTGKECVVVETSSVELLRQFRKGTVGLKSIQLKYVRRAVGTLRGFAFAAGIPGYKLFTIGNETRRHVYKSVMDYTLDMLT